MGKPLQSVSERRRGNAQLLRLAGDPLLLRLAVALGGSPHFLGLAFQLTRPEAIVLEHLNSRGHLADFIAAFGSLDIDIEIAAGEGRHQFAKCVDRFHNPCIHGEIGGRKNESQTTDQNVERIVAGRRGNARQIVAGLEHHLFQMAGFGDDPVGQLRKAGLALGPERLDCGHHFRGIRRLRPLIESSRTALFKNVQARLLEFRDLCISGARLSRGVHQL
ncbi:hypothetical protein ABIA25_005285 [Sinorhizobium fredii]